MRELRLHIERLVLPAQPGLSPAAAAQVWTDALQAALETALKAPAGGEALRNATAAGHRSALRLPVPAGAGSQAGTAAAATALVKGVLGGRAAPTATKVPR